MFLQMGWWDQTQRWITATHSSSFLAKSQDLLCCHQPKGIATWDPMLPEDALMPGYLVHGQWRSSGK